MRWELNLFMCPGESSCLCCTCWMIASSLLNCCGPLVQNGVTVNIRVYFCPIGSVLLASLSVLMPGLYCLDCPASPCQFLESQNLILPILLFKNFFLNKRYFLAISYLLNFHVNLKLCSPGSAKKKQAVWQGLWKMDT